MADMRSTATALDGGGGHADDAMADHQNVAVPDELLDQIDRLAGGDFTVVFDGPSPLEQRLAELVERLKQDLRVRLDDIVAQSANNMEATIAAARILDNARSTDDRAKYMTRTTEALVESVSQISEETKEAAKQAADAQRSTADSRSDSEKAAAVMANMTQTLQHTSDQFEALAQSSREIGSTVTAIDDIAKKTNMLALNASIEAVRAGHAGRGFAVVASEVKALSEQTAEATHAIQRNIGKLQTEIEATVALIERSSQEANQGETAIREISEAMADIDGQVSTIDSRMSNIAKILTDQRENTSSVAQSTADLSTATTDNTDGVNNLIGQMDQLQSQLFRSLGRFNAVELPGKGIQIAKADLAAWKKRLIDMSVGRASLNPSELADHRAGRFGKWYFGEAKAKYSGQPAYIEIEKHLKDLHSAGTMTANAFEAQNLQEALKHFAIVEQASADINRCLDELDTLANGGT